MRICRPSQFTSLVAAAIVCGVVPASLGQERGGDGAPPSPLEQALSDHACRAHGASVSSGDAPYQACLSTQLLTLRANFGRDLKRLSGADRRRADSRCTPLQSSRGPDAYVGCLSRELEAWLARRERVSRPAVVAPSSPDGQHPPGEALSDSSSAPTPESPAPSSATGLWTATVGVALGGVTIAGLYARRARRRAGTCRRCAVTLSAPGDLCSDCRREAVESRRGVASTSPSETLPVQDARPVKAAVVPRPVERQSASPGVDEARADETECVMEAERVRSEEDEGLRTEADRAERTRLAAQESRRAEDRRRREEELHELRTAVTASPDVFDPYLVLGVPRTASEADVRAAYATARQKFAPDEVAHLGAELREHFKAKGQAVERAYECLRSAANRRAT